MAEEYLGHGLTDLQVQTILVDRRDHEALLKAIEQPPKPTPALVRLMRRLSIWEQKS